MGTTSWLSRCGNPGNAISRSSRLSSPHLLKVSFGPSSQMNNQAVFDVTFGASGPQGVAGPQGSPGVPGPQGPAGIPGPQGPAGPQGVTGTTGAVGPTGPAGAVGPIGPAGPQGLPGSTGPQGPAGAPGAPGAAGPAGPQGPAGTQGVAGPQGPAGPSGGSQIPASQLRIALLQWFPLPPAANTFPAGNGPAAMAFDGANMWVADNSGNTVTEVRVSDGTTVGTF